MIGGYCRDPLATDPLTWARRKLGLGVETFARECITWTPTPPRKPLRKPRKSSKPLPPTIATCRRAVRFFEHKVKCHIPLTIDQIANMTALFARCDVEAVRAALHADGVYVLSEPYSDGSYHTTIHTADDRDAREDLDGLYVSTSESSVVYDSRQGVR